MVRNVIQSKKKEYPIQMFSHKYDKNQIVEIIDLDEINIKYMKNTSKEENLYSGI